MTPHTLLATGTAFLDEATENLTFDEFLWAFEEVWRGVAWVLSAAAPTPSEPALAPKGELPARNSLRELVAEVPNPPRDARVVSRLESIHDALAAADELETAVAVQMPRIERALFDAWELHDEVSRRLRVVDERLTGKLVLADVSPGRIGSQVIRRRTALKLLVASSLAPVAACKKVEKENRPAASVAPVADGSAQTAPAKIRAVSPLGAMQWETSDPFLFCAHHFDEYPEGNPQMGPVASLQGRHLGRDFDEQASWRMYHGREVPGFPRHPHRGFETVTVVRTGMLDHSDSMGATARYGAGDVQWLTAGGGIQHAEMFPLLRSDQPNPLELFQIWMNLPASNKMVDPHFTMLWNEKIPRVVEKDDEGRTSEITVAAGSWGDHRPPAPPPNSWASLPEADVAIWSIKMEPGAKLSLPAVQEGTERSLYFHRGSSVRLAEREVGRRSRVILEGNGSIEVVAGPDEVEILLLQGRPIDEPVAKRGPFVMNTQDEIRQAYADYQRTQFGGWPWRRSDPVHERVKGRFARHIDGTFEQPT